MEVQGFSDQELVERTRKIACDERRITELLLRLLEEVERRELHLAQGYGSLFDWVCAELDYPEDQAQFRIDAMRMIRDVPEAWNALGVGRLALTHLVKARRFFQKEKKQGRPYSIEQKLEVLREIEGTSTRECERRLAERSPEMVPTENVKALPGGFTQLSFALDAETMAQLEQLRARAGGISYAELIKKMVSEDVKRKIPSEVRESVAQQPTENVFFPEKNRHIPAVIRRFIWRRDGGRCTFMSEETGRVCGSTYAVQIDHLNPYSMGGKHDPENLRLLCRAHNQWVARNIFGSKVPKAS